MLIYDILYLWFEFFPFGANILPALRSTDIFDGIYHFNTIQQSPYIIWLYFSYQPKLRNCDIRLEPEARLVPGRIGATCIPVSLFVFAWSSRASVPWIAPIIGTAFFAPGFYLAFQPILNHLGESYQRYVASVFAGNTFFRSSFGGALPSAGPRMLKSLGIG
ncbi:hypothetical protein N7450_001906 [Penicillium hetheringtonii]|uniref:Uncharacterized protein n=1 Tax=Penicillium hetheringtonii TaxID=911720 RepID=A0AAD6H1U9_9EURO|nr:hypothetical protein N7450_001906 [Penicillium hetheringtonii]